jgi:hypothetical protein
MNSRRRVVNCESEAAMSISSRTAVTIAFLLLLVLLLPQSRAQQVANSVTVNPPEATVHVGQMQRFSSAVRGTDSVGIRWWVQEKDGGRITEDGVYTAPAAAGIYHVATSKADPAIRGVAKVTVVTEYDTPPER